MLESTQMRPPCSSTMRLAIESPRPVPPFLRVLESFGLLKFFKDLLLLGLRNAGPRIRHRDNEIAVRSRHLDPNLTRAR